MLSQGCRLPQLGSAAQRQHRQLRCFSNSMHLCCRPKEDNPYLILEDDEANASSMTDTAIGEVRHAPSRDVRQELGFFSSGELESPTKVRCPLSCVLTRSEQPRGQCDWVRGGAH